MRSQGRISVHVKQLTEARGCVSSARARRTRSRALYAIYHKIS